MEEIALSQEEQETESRKGLLVFWLRMIGWLTSGVAAPITTFAIKFGLFSESGYEVTTDELGNVTGANIALNGWGIASALLIGFTIINIISEITDAYAAKYSLAKQCLVGIKNKILPIAIILVICYFLKGVIDQIMFCLAIVGVSQIAAIPLNPLPKWKAQKKGTEDYSDAITGAVKFFRDYSKNRKAGK